MTILAKLRKELGLTQTKIALELGMSQQCYNRYETGKRQPDHETLLKLSNYFNVSVDYLLGRDEHRNAHSREPIYANENREIYIANGTEIKADFCLTCKGDSMIGARIHDGDIVFCRAQDIVENGEIAVVIIGDETTLKRFYYYPEKQKLVLQAENPAYEPLVYVNEELEQIKVIGKAVAFQSDIK